MLLVPGNKVKIYSQQLCFSVRIYLEPQNILRFKGARYLRKSRGIKLLSSLAYLNSNESYNIQRQLNVFLFEKCSPSSYFQIEKGKRNPKFGFLSLLYNYILARYLK